MRYFLELAYDGGEFCGWQRQPNAPSVQQRIEESLSTILRTPTPVTGAGRTDTGVHASQMYAHFDVEQPIHDNSRFLRSLDFMCGNSIAIRRLIPVAAEAHARFDATARTYKYLLSTRKDPFMRNLGWHCPYSLDFEK